MRRIIFLKIAGRDIHLPRLIGAFILFASLFMFIKASADMFDSWDNMKYVEKCMASVEIGAEQDVQQAQINDCRETLYRSTGVYLKPGEGKLTTRQFWSVLFGPIAAILFWLAILFVGWILYRTGELVLPIEEQIRDLPEIRRAKRK